MKLVLSPPYNAVNLRIVVGPYTCKQVGRSQCIKYSEFKTVKCFAILVGAHVTYSAVLVFWGDILHCTGGSASVVFARKCYLAFKFIFRRRICTYNVVLATWYQYGEENIGGITK